MSLLRRSVRSFESLAVLSSIEAGEVRSGDIPSVFAFPIVELAASGRRRVAGPRVPPPPPTPRMFSTPARKIFPDFSGGACVDDLLQVNAHRLKFQRQARTVAGGIEAHGG